MSSRHEARTERRGNYFRFLPVPVRAADNDAHGRASIAACGAWFEFAIDDFLRRECGLDPAGSVPDGCDKLRAHTFEASCRFHRVFGFPATIEAGLRVAELGSCSVRFEIGLFQAGDGDECKPLATGSVVRVFVSDQNDKPASLPGTLRACLARLHHPEQN